MATEEMKITKKRQVTIPKQIRERLKATSVYSEVITGEVVIRTAQDAAGAHSEYAGNADHGMSIKEMKGRAWEESVREKSGKESA
jgi:bifunctional DNA-binding transcriptional regulator/antitoxin component of YhaV-PrlF toxin-antitoxin module